MLTPNIKTQKGLAMVEMVIVTPLLLFLLLSVAELGRAFYQYNSLTKSVRDGARYLSTKAILGTTGNIDLTDAKITATKNVVIYGNISGNADDVPVIEGLSAAADDDDDVIQVTAPDAIHIKVSVSYPYQSLYGGTIPSFGMGTGELNTNFTLTASSTMRAL